MSKKLTKTNVTDKWVSGVIGGLSRQAHIGTTIPRLAFLFFLLSSFGIALVAYFILAVLIPDEEV